MTLFQAYAAASPYTLLALAGLCFAAQSLLYGIRTASAMAIALPVVAVIVAVLVP